MAAFIKKLKDIFGIKELSTYNEISSIYNVLMHLHCIDAGSDENIYSVKESYYSVLLNKGVFDPQHYDFLANPILKNDGLVKLTKRELVDACRTIRNIKSKECFKLFLIMLQVFLPAGGPDDSDYSQAYHDDLELIINEIGILPQ